MLELQNMNPENLSKDLDQEKKVPIQNYSLWQISSGHPSNKSYSRDWWGMPEPFSYRGSYANMSDMTLPLHEAFKIKSYSWEDRGISIDQARDKTTTPSKIEFFLGIRMEMFDPLLRKAIEIFANKGYIPYDSCQ